MPRIDKEKQQMRNALRYILKWNFATDGRKFNGNHKEVLKTIMDAARLGLPLREVRKIQGLKK